jgi:membrane protease YdiL (CAAX protease family)
MNLDRSATVNPRLIGMQSPNRVVRTYSWQFFAIALGLSWLFWIPAVLTGQDVLTFPVVLLLVLGGVGPALGAFLLLYRTQDVAGRRDYWHRLAGFRRISARWYAVILLAVPLLTGLGLLMDVLTGGRVPSFDAAARFLSRPLTILPFAASTLIVGPLPEELGWRGYALGQLQARWTALKSSLVLGLLWGLWHLPLFFMVGYYHHDHVGVGTLRFWLFFINIVALSVLYSWVFNNNRRTTLSAILFHFMTNFTGELFTLPVRVEAYKTLWIVIAAIAVTFVWGPSTLARLRTESP